MPLNECRNTYTGVKSINVAYKEQKKTIEYDAV